MPSRNSSTKEIQYKMTDDFYILLKGYLRANNITLKQLCENMGIEYYLVKKIIDRKIKMHIYLSFLEKLAEFCCISPYVTLGER